LLSAAIDLALIFKCDPYVFLNIPETEIAELYRLTALRMKEMKRLE
jgi:hypothetical protein